MLCHPTASVDNTCQQVVFPRPGLGDNPSTPGWGNARCSVLPIQLGLCQQLELVLRALVTCEAASAKGGSEENQSKN